ncbi:MAG: cytochrome C oxidase subunit IV family protein [Ignavibacteria bacterium]
MTNHNTEHTAEQHGPSYGMLIMVWLGLVALTSITVSVAGLHLGSLTLITALIIACTKTLLVANYFMHVKFESRLFKVFIFICVITFIIFVILTFTDLSYR